MSENWDFYGLQVDGQPASIFVDLGIVQSAPIPSHPAMGYLRLMMRQPREDGFSSQEEFPTLAAIEDTVIPRIAADGCAIYVGRNTSSGNRDFYFYTANADAFVKAANTAMTDFRDYDFEVGARPDPEWQTYFGFLYPSPEQRQCMGNRHMCAALTKHGDRIDQPRVIDHVALFSDRSNCEAYARYVLSQGFLIKRGYPSGDPMTGWRLEISRVDTPSEIDVVVLDLFRAAQELNGEYDGWGCKIVK